MNGAALRIVFQSKLIITLPYLSFRRVSSCVYVLLRHIFGLYEELFEAALFPATTLYEIRFAMMYFNLNIVKNSLMLRFMMYLKLGFDHCSKLILRILIGQYGHVTLRIFVYIPRQIQSRNHLLRDCKNSQETTTTTKLLKTFIKLQ